ncbi:AbrB/MazE/SpoVT family DNA-binding domain-containing protein [Candidatus Sumerlaeota bacterium]|nr:AbrB/MazE/SpoVT family DNA-binding domain-containing protein [Candidatus Sumerlaeota bacterium]
MQKWGNSLALRLPRAFAGQIGIENGSNVKLQVEDGKIIVIPLNKNELRLERYLSRITEENIHGETSFGKPVGRELL